jgi:hypothetical protein
MLDAHEDFVQELLARFPDITAQRVYEELCARQDVASTAATNTPPPRSRR